MAKAQNWLRALAPAIFTTPFTAENARLMSRALTRWVANQAVAATATITYVVRDKSSIGNVRVYLKGTPGAGESMTIQLNKNGSSILPGGTAVTLVSGWNTITLTDAGKNVVLGDVLALVRTYVAGGSPALTASIAEVDFDLPNR